MKRKEYIVPQIKCCNYKSVDLLSASGVTGDNGLGYGGVDESGQKDPDAKEMQVWDSDADTPTVWND